jgi:hypothetical protein
LLPFVSATKQNLKEANGRRGSSESSQKSIDL